MSVKLLVNGPAVEMRSATRFYPAILALVTILLFLPFYPGLNFPYRDQGVFLYGGWRMLQGEVPYVHFWDHKPPFIYFINAFGLWLTGGDPTGVWAVEMLFLLATVLLSYVVLRWAFGGLPALLGTLVWLVSFYPQTVDGGNLTEGYALLFQFLAMLCYVRIIEAEKVSPPYPVLLGMAGTSCFLLKQTTIETALAAAVLLIVWLAGRRGRKAVLQFISWVALGVVVLLGATLGYIVSQGAWPQFLDTFLYNFAYIKAGEGFAVKSIKVLIWAYPIGPLVFTLVPLSLGFYLTHVILQRGSQSPFPDEIGCNEKICALMPLAGLALMIGVGFLCLCGYNYYHYLTPLIPASSVFLGFFFYYLSGLFRQSYGMTQTAWCFIIAVWLVPMVVFSPGVKCQLARLHQETREKKFFKMHALQEMIPQDLPDQADPLLFWGAETAYNFLLKRPAPTRFVYQYPLWNVHYVKPEMVAAFTRDLIRNPPVLIIDTFSEHAPFHLGEHPKAIAMQGSREYRPFQDYPCKDPWVPFITWFREHYHKVGVIQASVGWFDRWEIYQLKK
jgi:hypothetical protein